MADLIQTYLPNVYKMGWLGQAGWGTAIYLTPVSYTHLLQHLRMVMTITSNIALKTPQVIL